MRISQKTIQQRLTKFIKKDLDNGFWIDFDSFLCTETIYLEHPKKETVIDIDCEIKNKGRYYEIRNFVKTYTESTGTRVEKSEDIFVFDGIGFDSEEEVLEFIKTHNKES